MSVNMLVRDVLDHYNIYYEDISHSNSELYFLCPFHDDTNIGNARFNEEDEIFNCFACGTGGNIYQFVAQIEGCTNLVASQLINNNFQQNLSYDVGRLKSNLERQYTALVKKQHGVVKGVLYKILSELSVRKPPLEVFKKWFPVFIFTHTQKVIEKDLLDLYEQFLQNIRDTKNESV